jgi:hypothetical protein
MGDRWTYASASDAIDAACEDPPPVWLAELSEDAYQQLLDAYWAEQELVHAGVEALEDHANTATPQSRPGAAGHHFDAPGRPSTTDKGDADE